MGCQLGVLWEVLSAMPPINQAFPHNRDIYHIVGKGPASASVEGGDWTSTTSFLCQRLKGWAIWTKVFLSQILEEGKVHPNYTTLVILSWKKLVNHNFRSDQKRMANCDSSFFVGGCSSVLFVTFEHFSLDWEVVVVDIKSWDILIHKFYKSMDRNCSWLMAHSKVIWTRLT